jgi:predicted metal-dependent HD superfamily phosphohydrolase
MQAWKNWRTDMCTEPVVITTKSLLPISMPTAMWAELEAAYQTPPRAYHNIQHVHEVTAHYQNVAASVGWQNPKEVYLAVLYHDAIYQAGRKDNEVRSAEMAVTAVAKYLGDESIDAARLSSLIEFTAKHGHLRSADLDSDSKHFLDCDMAILGAEPEQFLAYDKAIAIEYRGKLPGWMFQFYRRKFLRGLLDSPRIYLSDTFFLSHETNARANIEPLLKRPRSALLASSGR